MSKNSKNNLKKPLKLSPWIRVGVILKPHHRFGYVSIHALTTPIDLMFAHTNYYLGTDKTPLITEDIQHYPQKDVIKWKNIDDRQTALTLKGQYLYIKREEASNTELHTFYHDELIGCQVIHDTLTLGAVIGIQSTPTYNLLVLDKNQWMIPITERYVQLMDMHTQTITVNWTPPQEPT